MTNLIFGIFSTVCTLACLWFTVRLHWTTGGRWRKTEMGRHTMSFSVVLLVLLVLTEARIVFGDYPFRVPLLAIGFGAFSAVMVWRAALLEREQAKGRKRK